MYKIGDFSKITGFTVKALRYYDEEGILIPSQVLDSGYRLYSEEDFMKAMRIKLLKDFQFSIAEIKDVILNTQSDEELQDYLMEKKIQIEQEIDKKKNLIQSIGMYLAKENWLPNLNRDYHMKFKTIHEQLVMSYRFQGAYQDMGIYSPKLYKQAKNKVNGNIITLYYDESYQKQADMEVCLPIKVRVEKTDAYIKMLPEVYALTTIHIGKYEDLGYAYKALLDYASQHQLELIFPSRETYIKGPGMLLRGDPNKYITEIQIPIRKGEKNGV